MNEIKDPSDLNAKDAYDFRSLRCPHLLIAVIQTARQYENESIIEVLADDLNAPSSLSAWVRQSGHQLIDMFDDGHMFTFVIRLITT